MADVESTLTGEEFLTFQQKALDYLYDMPLGNDSLYMAKVWFGAGKELPPYRIKKISFSTPKIVHQFDDKIRHSLVDSVEYSDTVTIEWIEDAFNSVQKFHLGMLNQRVNFANGLWRVGGGPRMDMDVYHFAYVEGNKDVSSPFDSVAFPSCTEIFSFKGMAPEGIGDISYDSDAGGSVKTVSITYHCDNISMLNKGSADSMWVKDDFNGGTSSEIHLI